jgi:hypothetical protein
MNVSRRAFLLGLPLAAVGGTVFARLARAADAQDVHPAPRPGIDARSVLPDAQLGDYGAGVREVFGMVREMPHIADGIHCYCGCDGRDGNRSLLSCFGASGMAKECEICQGEARLAHRRWKEGQTLAQIRRAIDARFG